MLINKETIPGFLRTYVPLFVAYLVGLAAEQGIIIPESVSTPLTLLLAALAGALYYYIVRLLETHKGKFGWLLLAAKQPVYVNPAATPADQKVEVNRAIKEIAKTPENPEVSHYVPTEEELAEADRE